MPKRLRAVRTLTVLWVLAAAFQLSIFPLLREQPTCTEPCPGDSSEGQCPPMCLLAPCCSSMRATTPAMATSIPPPMSLGVLIIDLGGAPASAHTREVFHVPKASRS